jgi:hypothetical protein
MIIILGLVFLFPFSLPGKGKKMKAKRLVDAYMGGANIPGSKSFLGSAGAVREISFENYYLEKYFSENRLLYPSIFIALGLLIVLMIGAVA